MKTSLIILLLSFHLLAEAVFQKGSGAEYQLKFKDSTAANISIYLADVQNKTMSIEYFFNNSAGLIPINFWQQYQVKKEGSGPIELINGYVYAPEFKAPEKITKEYFNVNKGVEVNDFLFTKKGEIQKFYLGDEEVTVPAGTVKASHYRKSKNGQTIDFWISEVARPIGLIKLVSQQVGNPTNNYQLELTSLVKNVKATIDPKQAKPLSKYGKAYLAKPNKKLKIGN